MKIRHLFGIEDLDRIDDAARYQSVRSKSFVTESLSKYSFKYQQPERFSADEIRRRRTAETLRRARLELEERPERLSQANKLHLNKLKEFEDKFGREIEVHKRHNSERSMSRLFQLLQRRSALQERARQERTSNVEKPFVDRSFGLNPRVTPNVFVNYLGKHIVRGLTKTRLGIIPCIDRKVRREVLFAKEKAGIGHRTPHHKGPLSHIGC